MFYRNHFLSERTQTALLVLYALRRSYLSRGVGITKKDLVALTGFSAVAVNTFLSHLLSMKLMESEDRKFYPGHKLDSATLYDLIERLDGWVHLGNANLEGMTGNLTDRMYLSGCEACIRKGISDYLKSIRLISLLPGGEELLTVGSQAVQGHSEPAVNRDNRLPTCPFPPANGGGRNRVALRPE